MRDASAFDELLRSQPIPALLQRHRTHREAHWDRLVRVVLSVTPDDLDASGAVRWDAVTLRDLEAPVTRDAVRDWLAAAPSHAPLRALSALFDPRDPRALTWEDLLDLAREVYPDALAHLIPSPHLDPFDARRVARAGVDLAYALSTQKAAAPSFTAAPMLQWAEDATRARYLALAREGVTLHEFTEIGRQLAQAEEVSGAVRDAYGSALVTVLASVPRRDVNSLYVHTRLASAAALAAALRAPAKHVAVPERVMLLIAAQGFSHGADALAATLDHKRLGARAALALATMGPVGVAAARRRLDEGSLSSGRALAEALTALPSPAASLWDGEWYGLPRFGRTPADELLPPATWPAVPAHAPTPVEDLEAAVNAKPARELLPPTGWADLIQLLAIDPTLSDLRAAWTTARRLGRLGHGNDRGALVAALDTVAWSASITTHHPASEWGIGHALLWADCDREVFRHGVGRFLACGGGTWIGALARHFARALAAESPPWAPSVHALLWFYGASIRSSAWQGAPRVLASLDAPTARAALRPPGTDFWLTASVEGASRVTVRLRGSVELTVDIAAERWAVSAPHGATGATPPLDPRRPLRVAIETARDGMYVGIAGAMVHGPFDKLPMTVAPVEVVAEGEGAAVTSMTLREKRTAREAEAVGALLAAPDAAQGYTEVAGQRSPAAARLLATIARLGDAARAKLARDALATMKGAELDAWTQAPVPATVEAPAEGAVTPDTRTTELPLAFSVRSFEDVVRTFEAMRLTGKRRSKSLPALRRGPTQVGRLQYASFGPKPDREDWRAASAVPWPAVYLSADAPDTSKVEHLADEVASLPGLCRKGRGTWARVHHREEKGEFVVASLTVFPPEGDDLDYFMLDFHVAAWKVREGWAWGITETSLDDLARLVGVRAFPPRVEWTQTDRVVLGTW